MRGLNPHDISSWSLRGLLGRRSQSLAIPACWDLQSPDAYRLQQLNRARPAA